MSPSVLILWLFLPPSEWQNWLLFQEDPEAQNTLVVLQYSDHPEAPAFRPRPLHMPRHQRWKNQTTESHSHCLWWVSSKFHSDNVSVNILFFFRLNLCWNWWKMSQLWFAIFPFTLLIFHNMCMCFLNFRPSIYSPEAQTWFCDAGSGGTEILQDFSQTASVPLPWGHLVRVLSFFPSSLVSTLRLSLNLF